MRKISKTTPANLGLFPGANPVREVKRRNYHRAMDGDGGDYKALGRAPFRSLLERDLRSLLSANPEIESYAIEPHTLEYFIPNESGGSDRHTYVPDVIVRYRSNRIAVIDAKARFFANGIAWQKREPHITNAYHIDHNVPFVVLSEDVIRLQPRLSNCEIMKQHRYIVEDSAALIRTRDAIAECGLPATIADISKASQIISLPGSNRTYTAIINLALSGEIDLDLSKPLSINTELRSCRQ